MSNATINLELFESVLENTLGISPNKVNQEELTIKVIYSTLDELVILAHYFHKTGETIMTNHGRQSLSDRAIKTMSDFPANEDLVYVMSRKQAEIIKMTNLMFENNSQPDFVHLCEVRCIYFILNSELI